MASRMATIYKRYNKFMFVVVYLDTDVGTE